MRCLSYSLLLFAVLVTPSVAADDPTYLLAAELAAGDTSSVEVTLEVGGEMLLTDETGEKMLPLSVAGELSYLEQLLAWTADSSKPSRSVREYETATAKIQIEKGGVERVLPEAKRVVVAELRDGRAVLGGADTPLTRDQFDLINVVGNSLALNRLLPGRELAEGDTWTHDSDTIGTLLGMDNVAVCEVNSVVTGSEHSQVKIRLAGTVHGTIDGAATELDLQGAYLFHEHKKRITKCNLAIKELRTASQVVPGLDIVARIALTVTPTEKTFEGRIAEHLSDVAEPFSNTLSYESPERGYKFLVDPLWYVTGEQRDLVSLRLLREGNLTGHCNISTLPARSAGRETTLEEFERDVRQSLGKNLKSVSAATQWTTSQGYECLGVVAQGTVKGVAIEWRYYLIASPDLPRVSLGVTIEQSQIEQFNDADRQIVESLELLEKPKASTAKAKSNEATR